MSSTPKQRRFRSSLKFSTPSPSSAFKSPLLNKVEKKVDLENENISLEELKKSTLEMWQKSEDMKQEIAKLENEGCSEDQYKWYIDKLHEYNEVKDAAQIVMGQIAIIEETTVKKIHEQFGMTEND
ncbi:DNA repair protein SWI5 homolog isoform X2 [Parasteatoda tepidariorum]|uniref:DNA repair protein SWI5 homolog isoform X2 n=1 Tax=Parasteatoda tepidariorum TaxID=114398 RepID=UPI00077FA2EF|nr:DNA repair protein SWI5 homolog isoform X2 [Parasteatoda tepidariorum]